jgi:hypothetical protein
MNDVEGHLPTSFNPSVVIKQVTVNDFYTGTAHGVFGLSGGRLKTAD